MRSHLHSLHCFGIASLAPFLKARRETRRLVLAYFVSYTSHLSSEFLLWLAHSFRKNIPFILHTRRSNILKDDTGISAISAFLRPFTCRSFFSTSSTPCLHAYTVLREHNYFLPYFFFYQFFLSLFSSSILKIRGSGAELGCVHKYPLD